MSNKTNDNIIGTFFLINVKNFTNKNFREILDIVDTSKPLEINDTKYFQISHDIDFLNNNVSKIKVHKANILKINKQIELKKSLMLSDNNINNISLELQIKELEGKQKALTYELETLNYDQCIHKIDSINERLNNLDQYLLKHNYFKINNELFIDRSTFINESKMEKYIFNMMNKFIFMTNNLVKIMFEDNSNILIKDIYSSNLYNKDWNNLYKQEFKSCIYACYVLGNHFQHIKKLINQCLCNFVSNKLLMKYAQELSLANNNMATYEKKYLAENYSDVWNNFLKWIGIKKRYNIYGKQITLIGLIKKQFEINKAINNNIRLYVENHKRENFDYFDFIFYEEPM